MTNSSRCVLVVDDDAIRLMVERVLQRENIEVECARDGFEAIEKLASRDYGAILLDLMMPRVDGVGVLRYLERSRPDDAPPVILMTANVEGAEEAASLSPVVALLAKPFDIQQMVRQVRRSAEASSSSSN
ncbi:MAG: response regulator [Thermoanaerobaculia bacterium]